MAKSYFFFKKCTRAVYKGTVTCTTALSLKRITDALDRFAPQSWEMTTSTKKKTYMIYVYSRRQLQRAGVENAEKVARTICAVLRRNLWERKKGFLHSVMLIKRKEEEKEEQQGGSGIADKLMR